MQHNRILVLGCSGSGKTTFARRLGEITIHKRITRHKSDLLRCTAPKTWANVYPQALLDEEYFNA